MTNSEFIILMTNWRKGRITKAEGEAFIAACNSGKFDELLQDTLESHLSSEDLRSLLPVDGKERVWERLEFLRSEKIIRPVHRVHFLRTAWFRAAVAVLIILTGVVVYDQFSPDSKSGNGETKSAEALAKADVLPGSDKAILILSDGRKVELNNEGSEIIKDAGLTIRNDNGELNYGMVEGATHPGAGAGSDYVGDALSRRHPSEGGDWQASYNTMATPRGGQYKLVLPDGSKVWLNAESSITFPTVFTGKTREIKMTGEVYFEIKTDKSKPFIVKTISDEIQVLGTSFNINAYNEAPVKTSLLEGSVKVNARILKPGQAYQQNKITSTNINQDIAWKNGLFHFDHANIQVFMQQVTRWYDVNVQYEGKPAEVEINGKMGRNLKLNQVLSILKDLNIKFRLEGKTIIISS